MVVSCESWRSHWQENRISDNPHYLTKHNIANVRSSKQDGVTWGELERNVFISTEGDGVRLLTGVEGLNIQGNQVVIVRLTKEEIANLVRIAWGDKSLNDFIDACQ